MSWSFDYTYPFGRTINFTYLLGINKGKKICGVKLFGQKNGWLLVDDGAELNGHRVYTGYFNKHIKIEES